MAAKTNSKDLRRLMKEKLNSSKKKINSPLAKYNNAGQLFCVLCNTILKSDLLWDAHIRGAKHKENLIVLKSGRPKTSANPAKHHPVQKPRHEIVTFTETGRTTVESLNKKRKEEISSLSSETPEPKKLRTFSQPVKSSVPSDFFDKDLSNSADDQDKIPDNEMDTSASVPSASGLPTDFFDCPSTDTRESESIQSSKEKESNKSEAIPEGFFDDPKLDAKVRNVEYKDPAEEEWEKFQKALSTENQVSEAIIYEEEEESRIDRALDEISEQRLYYLRADVLRDKQSAFKKTRDENREQCKSLEMKDESESDSDDIENLFNWRAKKAL